MPSSTPDTPIMTEGEFQRFVIATLIELMEEAGWNPNLERLSSFMEAKPLPAQSES